MNNTRTQDKINLAFIIAKDWGQGIIIEARRSLTMYVLRLRVLFQVIDHYFCGLYFIL